MTPAQELREAIATFVQSCQSPVLLEPGLTALPLTADTWDLSVERNRVQLAAWSDAAQWRRAIAGAEVKSRGRMELRTERFARQFGKASIVDTARQTEQHRLLTSRRQSFREELRAALARIRPGWRIELLSTEADLEHSLSPAFPRALLVKGKQRLAALAAPPGTDDALQAFTFGLLWFDHLRRRGVHALSGLILVLPAGDEKETALLVDCLDPQKIACSVYAWSPDAGEALVQLEAGGNLFCRLPLRRQTLSAPLPLREFVALEGFQCVELQDGSNSLRIHGLPFAHIDTKQQLRIGVPPTKPAGGFSSALALAKRLAERRSSQAKDRSDPWYTQQPEAWLAASLRRDIHRLDATLQSELVCPEAPLQQALRSSRMDLLFLDQYNRLAIVEVKAKEDIHHLTQALHYWQQTMERTRAGLYNEQGYFRGRVVSMEAPRIFLVAPALEFHSAISQMLPLLRPEIAVQLVGVDPQWRQRIKVAFHHLVPTQLESK
jgi:hypothetical protein